MRLVERHTHLAAREDGVTTIRPVLDRCPDFAVVVETDPDEAAFERLRRAESIGRPLGDERFLARLEAQKCRSLKPEKRGCKRARLHGPAYSLITALSP